MKLCPAFRLGKMYYVRLMWGSNMFSFRKQTSSLTSYLDRYFFKRSKTVSFDVFYHHLSRFKSLQSVRCCGDFLGFCLLQMHFVSMKDNIMPSVHFFLTLSSLIFMIYLSKFLHLIYGTNLFIRQHDRYQKYPFL